MKKRLISHPLKGITMRNVAELADTSVATVSYVLNNEDRYIRPELKERVLAAARELGYLKNAAASSLKGKRRGILAILVAQFGNSFFTRMCVDIEEVARQEGYIVTMCNSYEDPVQERLILERLIAQRIDGCILCPALSRESNAAFLSQHHVPFVILERTLPAGSLEYDFVGHDNYQSGYMATCRLLESGHRRIAFLGWDSPIPNVRERADGYRAALREHGIPAAGELVVLDDMSPEAGVRMGTGLALENVTAVVLGHHEIAKGTLTHFMDKGVVWPKDISLVVIGTPEWADMMRPGLTCIQRPEKEMGQAAAAMLLEKIRDPHRKAVQQMFDCKVLEGGSVRDVVV